MKLFRVFIICFLLAGPAYAQFNNWSQVVNGELESADLRAYLWHNNTLYAGSRGGIFKSTDKGQQWNYSSSGLAENNSTEVNCLAVLNDTLFAGTTFGLAKSINGGASWVPCTDAGGMRQYIDKVFSLGNAIIITSKTATNEWKMFRSTDYGKSWTSGSHIFLSRPNLYKVRNDFLLIDRGADSLYRTTDGLTVTHFPTVLPSFLSPNPLIESFTGDTAQSSNYVYAIANYTNVCKLNLTTGIWDDSVNINYSPRPEELYTLFYFNGKLIVCGISYNPFTPNLYVSYNKGYDWAKLAAPFGVNYPLMQNIIWLGGNELAASFYYENYHTTNSGINWSKRTTGFYASMSGRTISSGSVLLSPSTYKGVLRSTDDGLNWLASNSGIGSSEVFVSKLMHTGKKVYASLRIHLGDSMRLYSSSDDGLNWIRCNIPAGMIEFDFLGSNDSSIFIRNKTGSNTHTYRSVDHGNSFQNIQSKLPLEYSSGTGMIESVVGARDTLLALGKDAFGVSRLFISTDNAETFMSMNSGIPVLNGSSVIRILPGGSYFLAVIHNVNDSIKYLAGSSSWIPAKGMDLPEEARLYIVDQADNRLFASTNQGIFVSDSWGYRWVFIDKGPHGGIAISRFISNGQFLFLATEQDGIWKNSLRLGVKPLASATGGWIAYPNPSTGKVMFKREKNPGGTARLEIFDLQGKCVLSDLIGTGSEEAFDLSTFRQGLYMYHIHEDEGSSSGKLLISSQ